MIDSRADAPIWFSFQKPSLNSIGHWHFHGDYIALNTLGYRTWDFPDVTHKTPLPATLTISLD